MSEYIVKRTVTFILKVEAVDEADALDHARENIYDIEDATSKNVFEVWEVEECIPYDRPPTEEEEKSAEEEAMGMSRAEFERQLWDKTPEGMLHNAAREELFKEIGGIGIASLKFEEYQKLIPDKVKESGLEWKFKKKESK